MILSSETVTKIRRRKKIEMSIFSCIPTRHLWCTIQLFQPKVWTFGLINLGLNLQDKISNQILIHFTASKVNLAVHEDKNKSVYVKGATERSVRV